MQYRIIILFSSFHDHGEKNDELLDAFKSKKEKSCENLIGA